MRLRGRLSCKCVAIIIAVAILLVVTFNYLKNLGKDSQFLKILPTEEDYNEFIFKHRMPFVKKELLNLTDFDYEISNDVCKRHSKELLAIIIVTSYVGNDDVRAAHRQAVAQSKLAEMGIQRVFLLAKIPPTEEFIKQEQIHSEQKRFGDLLQGNFVEAYRNLSYKHIMGLRWAATECIRTKFIIKLDDDIIYDIFHLRRYLEELEVGQPILASSKALLAGFILDYKAPIRNTASKWYVPEQEYSATLYPTYLSGWLYITNPLTALRIVNEAQNSPYFWIDDTWVTGIIRERLDIPLQRLNSWYSPNPQFLECCARDLKQSNFECEYFIGPNGGDSKLLIEFLHNVEKCYFDECLKRPVDMTLKTTCITSAKLVMPPHGRPQVHQVQL